MVKHQLILVYFFYEGSKKDMLKIPVLKLLVDNISYIRLWDWGPIGTKLEKKNMLYAKKRISMLTGFRNHLKIISRNRATVLTRCLNAFKISYLALSENAVDYCILSYHLQDVNP